MTLYDANRCSLTETHPPIRVAKRRGKRGKPVLGERYLVRTPPSTEPTQTSTRSAPTGIRPRAPEALIRSINDATDIKRRDGVVVSARSSWHLSWHLSSYREVLGSNPGHVSCRRRGERSNPLDSSSTLFFLQIQSDRHFPYCRFGASVFFALFLSFKSDRRGKDGCLGIVEELGATVVGSSAWMKDLANL